MKFKRILILLLSSAALQTMAQSGLYLKPSAGVGFGKSQGKPENTLASSSRIANLHSFSTTVGAGYRFKNWCIESGIGYVRSSHPGQSTMNLHSLQGDRVTAPYRLTHKHVVIPFRIGYQIRVNRRLYLQPALGASAYLNHRSMPIGFQTYQAPAREKKIPSSSANISMGAETQINATYRVHANIELFGGPALHYMLGASARKNQPILFVQPPYSLMMNCGINWYIPRPVTPRSSEN